MTRNPGVDHGVATVLNINLCDFLGRQSTFLRLNDVRCVHGLFVQKKKLGYQIIISLVSEGGH